MSFQGHTGRSTARIQNPTDPTIMVDVEQFNEALATMDVVHLNIHRGRVFSSVLAAEALADDGTLEMLIQTPATGAIHARWSAASGGDAQVELFEDTTVSAVGAAVPEINRNRFSSNATTAAVTSGPTVTGDGTELFNGYIPGGQGGNAGGGSAEGFEEFILAQSSNYMLRLTNRSGQARVATITLVFYDTNFST